MQWVKNPALSVQWPGLLLGYRFSPWPGDFHMLLVWPLKKKKRRRRAWMSRIRQFEYCKQDDGSLSCEVFFILSKG